MGNAERRYLLDYLDWTNPGQRLLARAIANVLFSGGFFVFVILYFRGTNWINGLLLAVATGVGWQAAFFFLLERQGIFSRVPVEESNTSEFSTEDE